MKAKFEHKSTVEVRDLKVGDEFDDGHDTVYEVKKVEVFGDWTELVVAWGGQSELWTIESWTLMGLLNR